VFPAANTRRHAPPPHASQSAASLDSGKQAVSWQTALPAASTPGDGAPGRLVFVSKSAWEPPIRREHAFAGLAIAHGHGVWFIESPMDVRALRAREARRRFLAGIAGRGLEADKGDGLRLVPTAAPIPGHRGAMAQAVAAALLRRDLSHLVARAAPRAVIATTPWQWPAVRALRGVRRVFDGADDWRALLPRRREAMEALYREVAEEADAVIVASGDLAALFEARHDVLVVPNGTSEEVLAPPPAPPPKAERLVYVGTLSRRFDAPMVADVLRRLRGWRLDLYGPCQYPGRGDAPDEELQSLLVAFPGRVTWHGVVPRSGVAAAIDDADVALLPNRSAFAAGQDPMKLYDYAARGRPVVATGEGTALDSAAGVYRADTLETVARGIEAAANEPLRARETRREWAASQRWCTRWQDWSSGVFGASAVAR
jgi:glycosyltransferase involved in cell wall biosynthesis